ncbi:GntR family transcriptional regulator [Actinokineospora baliensis]|uniref:GntR family transcriptional regulator n=1 Tax=Actinokineospora baliensis TaxID=547056 RepID=UPI0027DC4BD8|nr:GntR family transcriptional regulator [Actinokineospora baliensis]MBM7774627.1 GntR family transcriptional regulator [Actinokineospora baliensis]
MFAFRMLDRSGVPAYLQLVDQVRRGLLLGHLQGGDQLPTVRAVAAGLVINPNTVAKAYRELERAGLAVARAGLGTFATDSIEQVPATTYARLSGRLRQWLADAKTSGLAPEQVRAMIDAALDDEQRRDTA